MLKPGDVLRGDYVIERLLGRGGMGCVYLARQPSLADRLVAIKELVLEGEADELREAAVAQFRREAQTLGSIEHPNLVDVKDFFCEGGVEYLVMGHIDGVTLEDVVRDNPRFVPCGLALAWADAMCDVLQCLHAQSPPIIVRDLKPANVMIDVSGRLRLIDFGIARHAPAGSQTSTWMRGVGTVGYSPLEQYGMGGTDARSDVYSLGATLYAVLTRTTPAWSIGRNTGEEHLVPASRLNPAVPSALEAVIDRMMALRAADRYPDVGQARQALREAAASAAPAPPPFPRRFCSSCGAQVVAVAARCHHCRVPFEDADTLFPVEAPARLSGQATLASSPALAIPPPPVPVTAPPVAPPSTSPSLGTPVPPPPASLAPPSLGVPGLPPPTSLALPSRPPVPARGGPSLAVALVIALLAGALIFAAVRVLRPSPAPAPTAVAVTAPAPSLVPSPRAAATPSPTPVATPTPSPVAEPSPSPAASPSPSPALETPTVGDIPPLASPSRVESRYLMPDSARRALTDADLAGRDARELCLVRNEIFARHGRVFETPEIRAWFEAQAWYRPRKGYRDAVLTPLERRNARFVLQYEDAHGYRWP